MATTTLVESQKNISLKITTTLGENAVIMESLDGFEAMSLPFEFTLRLVSSNPQIPFETIMGKSVTVSIDCYSETRYINGVVGQFTQLITAKLDDDNATYYEAKIYPSLWMLNFVQDCRIFQNKTPMEIVLSLLKENGIQDVTDATQTHGRQAREYCVQYNETTFDFINRLLEEEGIFYFFQHEKEKHILILADNSSIHEFCKGYETVEFEKGQPHDKFLGFLTACSLKQHVIPQISTASDYNFTLASIQPLTKILGEGEGGEMYFYPALSDHEDKPDKKKVEDRTRLQRQKEETPHKGIEGASTIPFFLPGYKFHLKDHPRHDANQVYVLLKVTHRCHMAGNLSSEGSIYENTFEAYPNTTIYRPPSRSLKPRIYSTQTAKVTGPENEEIWTDKYGRIKVLFHWDRLSNNDQESSCWVRVAEGWAGNNWGILFTPRIGMEVVVTFIEGDPDRPLVIGSVYNSDHMPPYLPDQPTKSTIKSRSTKESEGFNELRFEDLKNSEQIYLHAQKDRDFRVQETATDWIEKGSQWLWIDQGNRETIIGGSEGVQKTTPEGQSLPAGTGDENLTLLSGSKTVKLLGQSIQYNIIIPEGDHFLEMGQGKKITMGGILNEFRRIYQGKYETLITTGDHHEVIGQGNHENYIETGNKITGIEKGDLSQEVITGNLLLGVTSGNLMSVVETGVLGMSLTNGTMMSLIEKGDYKFRIQEGNSDSQITQGSEKTHLLQGDHSLKIDQGNQSIEIISGNRSIQLKNGNEDHFTNGAHQHHVTGNYTLEIDGNLTITVTGATRIVSEGEINFSTPSNIRMSAGENINLTAGMSIMQEAGTTLTQTAGMSMTSTANLEMAFTAMSINQTAETTYTLEAGLESTLTSSLSTTITSAIINLA